MSGYPPPPPSYGGGQSYPPAPPAYGATSTYQQHNFPSQQQAPPAYGQQFPPSQAQQGFGHQDSSVQQYGGNQQYQPSQQYSDGPYQQAQGYQEQPYQQQQGFQQQQQGFQGQHQGFGGVSLTLLACTSIHSQESRCCFQVARVHDPIVILRQYNVHVVFRTCMMLDQSTPGFSLTAPMKFAASQQCFHRFDSCPSLCAHRKPDMSACLRRALINQWRLELLGCCK